MRLRAEVSCYHCGRVSGTWEWLSTSAGEWGLFQELGNERCVRGRLPQLRCSHCGGPVFLDEITRVATPAAIAFQRPRRGRPPKETRCLVS
jgi:hypothetical protein